MPLSEHERRLLDEIEQSLRAEDRRFALSIRSGRVGPRTRIVLALCVVSLLVGFGLVVLGAGEGTGIGTVVAVAGFVVIVASCWCVWRSRRSSASPTAGSVVTRAKSLRAWLADRQRRGDEN